MECRSALYMPASNRKALNKGPSLDADAIIIDLEDSVAPDSKALAREQAVQALSELDYGHRLRILRINGRKTPWYEADLAAAAQCPLDGIALPKVNGAEDIIQYRADVQRYAQLGECPIWAMVESPAAVVNAVAIAATREQYPQLAVFVVGTNDLALAAGMPAQPERELLLPWLMTLVAAARARDMVILDGVFNDFSDTDGLERECQQGRNMGMHGKTLIHPSQLAVANRVFAPSDAEISDAEAVVDAFNDPQNADKGVIAVNGRMVERLHLQLAQSVLRRAAMLRR